VSSPSGSTTTSRSCSSASTPSASSSRGYASSDAVPLEAP
jgi:hypothetical protein